MLSDFEWYRRLRCGTYAFFSFDYVCEVTGRNRKNEWWSRGRFELNSIYQNAINPQFVVTYTRGAKPRMRVYANVSRND